MAKTRELFSSSQMFDCASLTFQCAITFPELQKNSHINLGKYMVNVSNKVTRTMSIDVQNFYRCCSIVYIADFEQLFTHKVYLLIMFKVNKTPQLHQLHKSSVSTLNR